MGLLYLYLGLQGYHYVCGYCVNMRIVVTDFSNDSGYSSYIDYKDYQCCELCHSDGGLAKTQFY